MDKMKLKILFFVFLLVCSSCALDKRDIISSNFDFADIQLKHAFVEMDSVYKSTDKLLANPRNIDPNGFLRMVASHDWTSGFFPGELWYMYEYTKDDFCKLENFPDKIGKEENVAYIWEIVTDKNYMGKGIASKLMQYVLEKFKGYKIYSCIAKDNIPSLKLHEKYGFKEAYQFTNDKEQLMLLKNN